jgi:aminopeptidase N
VLTTNGNAVGEAGVSVSDQAAPLRRSMLWGALWDYVHVAKTPPRGYVELALKSLPEETDESLARIQGARVAVALHSYLHEGARQSLTPRPESVIGDRMLKAPTLGLRIVSFRSFRSIAETPAGLQQVKGLLGGKLVVPGLTLKRLDRWELIGHLIAIGDPQCLSVRSFLTGQTATLIIAFPSASWVVRGPMPPKKCTSYAP